MAGGDSCEEKSSSGVMFYEVFSNFGNKLLEFLDKQRKNHAFCDCVIVVENVEFPAHLCVIGASSDVLLQQLTRFRENNFSKVTLDNVTYAGFLPLAEYMYSGVLKFEMCHFQLVHHCAKSLGMRDLDKFWDQYIKNSNQSGKSLSVNIDTDKGCKLDCGIIKKSEKISSQDNLVQPQNKGFVTSSNLEMQVQCNSNTDCAKSVENCIGDGPQILNDYLSFFATLSATAPPIPDNGDDKSCQERTFVEKKSEIEAMDSQTYKHTVIDNNDNAHLQFCYKDAQPESLCHSKQASLDALHSVTNGDLSNQTTFTSISFSQPVPKLCLNIQDPSPDLLVSTTSNKQATGRKRKIGSVQLRKRRKPMIVNTNDDQLTTKSTLSEETVYVKAQAPSSIDPSQSIVQRGQNAILSEPMVATTVNYKVTPKRKRTKPRKLQQTDTSTETSASAQLCQRGKAKRKTVDVDKDSDDGTRQTAYNCPLCPRVFFRESSLKKHCEGHAFGGIHRCQVCGRSYVRLCDFTRHVRSHGTLRCEHCEFSTKSQKQFVDHNVKKHSSPKPFRCHFPDCIFSSGKLHDLDEHRLIHSDVKCFTCNFCDKTFSQKGGLYSHKKSCLQKRDFLCDICGRAFNHLGSMKSHRRIHIGEKPFQCSECSACFSDHRNLKRHKLIHENVFPYTCEYCDKIFRHSNSLKSHIRRQHVPNQCSGSPDMTEEKLTYLTPPANPYMVPLEAIHEDSILNHDRAVFDNQGMVMAGQMFPVQSETAYINQIQLQPPCQDI